MPSAICPPLYEEGGFPLRRSCGQSEFLWRFPELAEGRGEGDVAVETGGVDPREVAVRGADLNVVAPQLPRDVREDVLLFELLFQLCGPEAPRFKQLQRGLRLQKAVDVRQLPEPREQTRRGTLADGGRRRSGEKPFSAPRGGAFLRP